MNTEILLDHEPVADGGYVVRALLKVTGQAPDVFEAEIDGLMALAAQNLAVTLKPGMAVDHATVLHGYPSSENDVATLTLEGHVLLPDGGIEKLTLTVPITVDREHGAVAHPEVRREMILLQAARAREEAVRDRREGRFDDGARKLREVAERLAPLAEAAAVGDDPDLAADLADDLADELADELADLRDMAARFEDARVSEADAKYMRMRSYSLESSKPAAAEMIREKRRREREER